MKLKKIVSLTAAALMAVSMLAGCNGATKPNTPDEPETPATGVSAEVGALVEDAPKCVTFADSTKLDSALDYTMEWAGVEFVLNNYVHETELKKVDEFDEALESKLEVEDVDFEDIDEIGNINVYTDGDGAIAYELYAVSGSIGKDAVEKQIADKLNAIVADYKAYDDKNGDNWYYDYTVSVSIDSKTVNSAGVGSVNGGVHGSVDSADTIFGSFVDGSINGGIHGNSTSAENPTVTFVAVQVVRAARAQD